MWLSADTIDKWDEDKLKEVVEKKHGDKSKPRTDIVSLGECSLVASSLVPRPHPAQARRRGLVSQVQIIGVAPELGVANEITEQRLLE